MLQQQPSPLKLRSKGFFMHPNLRASVPPKVFKAIFGTNFSRMANSGIDEAANKSLKLTVAARVCLTCDLRQLVFRLTNSWKQRSKSIILRRVEEAASAA
jgi:hypothetical protein